MFASLVVAASVAAAVFLVSSSPVGWALALVPILVAGVPMSVVGVLKGVKAARGNGAPRAFGCLGMFVCMVLFAVPGVAMVVWVVLLLIR